MKRTHVQVGGPLGPYAPSFVKALEEQGYGYRAACDHLYLMAQLSRWLEHRGLAVPQLTPELGEEFVAERRRTAQLMALAVFVHPFRLNPYTLLVFPYTLLVFSYTPWRPRSAGVS